MISSQPADKGTVYMGDGAFGAVLQPLCHPDASMHIFAKFKSSHNMWISQISSKEVHHIAIDSHGNKLDEFTQDPLDYK